MNVGCIFMPRSWCESRCHYVVVIFEPPPPPVLFQFSRSPARFCHNDLNRSQHWKEATTVSEKNGRMEWQRMFARPLNVMFLYNS